MMESTIPTQSNESPQSGRNLWFWRYFPTFWTALFVIGLALDTLGVRAIHPERLYGWRAIGLGVLLIAVVGGYQWFTWRRLYRNQPVSTQRALLALGVQLLSLLLLVVAYDSSFAWFSLALLYQIVGGLPRRYWPLPLAGVLLVFVAAALVPSGSAALDAGSIVGATVLLLVNLGIAVFIRLLNDQRDQLRSALEQLQDAHATLAANAAQAEELAILRERTRLAREMHDDLGHALVAMNVKLEAAQLLYARDPARGDAELEETRTLIRRAMANLRRTLADLRAPIAEPSDLPAALQRLARETQARTGIELACRIAPKLPTLPDAAREALWYVAREALANVERHAAATSVNLNLEQECDSVRLRVVDDGLGITPDDLRRPKHYGVIGMRERMQVVGGTLNIGRGSSGGTVVEALMPLHAAEETSIR